MKLSKSSCVAGLSLLAALGLGCDKSKGEAPAASAAPSAAPAADAVPPGARVIDVSATNDGYSPSSIDAKQGETVVLRFTRKTKSECLSEVKIPKLNISKELPVDQPVNVVVKADAPGDIGFQCGMAMVHGTIHVSGS